MKPRPIWTFARALAAGGFAAIVAACVAPVSNEGNASEGNTNEATEGEKGTVEEALPNKCSNGNEYLVCPPAGRFNTTRFERGLAALKCAGKLVEEGNGTGKDAIFQARCSLSAKATFDCEVTCYWGRDFQRICTPAVVTGGIRELIQCNRGVAHLDATTTSTTECGCSNPAPAGDTYVLWDPTCSSASCLNRYL